MPDPQFHPENKTAENPLTSRTRRAINNFFEQQPDGLSRINAILTGLEPLFIRLDRKIISEETLNTMKQAIHKCETISEQQAFTDSVIVALQPILSPNENRAAAVEETMTDAMNDHGNFTKVNRLISYNRDKDTLHLHHAHGSTVQNKRELYTDALEKLAAIVHQDPSIKKIEGTSWIVAAMPRTIQRVGFTVTDIDDERKKREFPHDDRPVQTATMTREELLARYLNKN